MKEKSCPYVSRGGLKLKGALDSFGVSVKDKICVDIGVATGGFSHCFLLEGAKQVYGVDVGKGQLASEILKFPNFVFKPETNARYLEPSMFPVKFEVSAVDVSFISLTKIIGPLMSCMAAGADMASVSMHKSGGSLTQSSLLLIGPNVHPGYVRQIINLTQTTSGSYLLMSSLDISRRNLALRGRQVFHQVADMAEYAREEINAVGGYYAFGKELCNGDSVFDFDTTKLSVHTLDIGLAGIEVYDILRDEYDIQIEFGDIGNILAYLSIGDRPQEIERLVSALAEIKRRYHTDGTGLLSQEYIDPVVAASPQEAFYAPKKSLPLRETEGMVCSEFVMCYPPGIPILAPGERITKEILNYIEYAKAKGCSMTGPEDPEILHLNVLA
jgi:arginine/lysine/ornithine decarboxylase